MTKVIRTIPQRDEKAVHPVHTSGERLGASRTPAPSRLVSVVPRDGMFCNPHPTINRWATIPPGLGSCASVRLDTYSNGMDHPGQRNETGSAGFQNYTCAGWETSCTAAAKASMARSICGRVMMSGGWKRMTLP